jgi:hypothetical protein
MSLSYSLSPACHPACHLLKPAPFLALRSLEKTCDRHDRLIFSFPIRVCACPGVRTHDVRAFGLSLSACHNFPNSLRDKAVRADRLDPVPCQPVTGLDPGCPEGGGAR